MIKTDTAVFQLTAEDRFKIIAYYPNHACMAAEQAGSQRRIRPRTAQHGPGFTPRCKQRVNGDRTVNQSKRSCHP